MIYLLDSNAVSDLMREQPKLVGKLAGLGASHRVVTCTIVKGEIHYGLGRLPEGKKRADLERKARDLLAVLPCAPVPEEAADHYARIKLTRESKGLALDENDLWIAATAFVLGAELISRDADFRRVEGLTVNDWTK